MEEKYLLEICNPKQWKTIPKSQLLENGKFPVYGANGIIGRYNEYNHEKPTVLITCRGATCGNIHITVPNAYINGNAMALDNLNEIICKKEYLYYFLQYYDMSKIISGTAQPQITITGLKKVKVKLYSINKQEEIVNELNKINKLIKLKKRQLEELQKFIKSQFVEMFGTIKENKKKYPIKSLIEVFELIKDGTHSTPVYINDKKNGVKFLSAKDITKGRIDWDNTKYIPIELHEKLVKRIKPQLNDILLAKNGTTGICAKVNKEEVFDIYVSLALLRPNLENCSDYLVQAINNEETKEQFKKSLKGVGVPNLHLGEIKKVKIIVPPLPLQNKFSEIVKQIDKQKFEIEKSLKETQELYESLMEKYFG